MRIFYQRSQTATRKPQAGVTYVEVLLAIVVLSVCLVPMLESVRNALSRRESAFSIRNDIACVKSHMETIAAETYSSLLKAATAAGNINTATSYSLPATATCPARQVFISPYDPDNTTSPFANADTGLLFIKVISSGNSLQLTTFATRQ